MQIDIFQLKDNDFVAYNLVKASWLQKSIRRGLNEKALSIADLYISDNQEKGLLRRLKVFATEDIGIGNIDLIQKVESFNYDVYKFINILCQSNKNREIDRFLLYTDRIYNPKNTIHEDSLKKEVYNLKKLLLISEKWFLKKNKENKNNIINFIEKLKIKYKTNKSQDNLIEIALSHYFELSKFKTLGARTNLAFIILIIIRGYSKDIFENKINLSFNNRDHLKFVDDWALDKHTPFGKKLNRGIDFWLEHGSIVVPEVKYNEMYLPNGDEKYSYEKIFT